MKLLVACDIFGDTPELRVTAKTLSANFVITSPYPAAQQQFGDEAQAYAAFLAGGGIDSYAQTLAQAIDKHRPDALVGFSVGATACWLTLSGQTHHQTKSAILFYGSRIREHLQLRPYCPVKLFFAEHEKSCAPRQLVTILRAAGLEADICAGSQHGFMNERSLAYDPVAQKMGLELTLSALNELE